MRIYFFVLLKTLFFLILLGIFFSSFQQPKDKNQLKERIEWCKQQKQLDSLAHYQQLLQKTLKKEGSEVDLLASGTYFMSIVMQWEKLETKEKKTFLENTPISLAWSYAFQIKLHLELNKQDSAYFYQGLLNSTENNSSALAYAYGAFALNFSKQKTHFKETVEYLQKAEKAVQTVFDSVLLYPLQTRIYQSIGYVEEAIIAAQKSIDYLKKEQYLDGVKLAFLYNQLADIYLEQSAYHQAKIYYGEAINYMASHTVYPLHLAKMWYKLATCYFAEEDKSSETILYLRNCLKQLEFAKDNNNLLIDACHLMASEFVRIVQLDSASIYLQKAINVQKKQPYQLGKTNLIQGEIALKQQKNLVAENAFFQAALLEEKEFGVKSIQAAKAWLKTGEVLLLQEKFKQAQIALDKGFWGLSTQPLSKNLPPIESIQPRVESIALLSSKITAMLGLYERSQYNVSLKEIEENAAYNLKLLQHIYYQTSSYRHESNMFVDAYEKGVETCLLLHEHKKDKSYLHQAFLWIESFKKITLQEEMKESSNTFGSVSNDMINQEILLQKRINWYQHFYWNLLTQNKSEDIDWCQQQIASFQAELTLLNQAFKKQYPKYESFKNSTVEINLDSIQQALKTNTAIIQYLEGNKSVYQVVIRKDTFAFRKIFWEEYRNSVLKYYKHFTDPKLIQHAASGAYKDFCRTSYELYHKLVHHELLNSCNQLVVIPDGLLNYVPFETLLMEIPLDSVHKINFPSLAYLLKQKSIYYNYSSSLWLEQIKEPTYAINNEILGMGATYENQSIPDFRGQQLKDSRAKLRAFKNTQNEMDSLAKKYDGDFYTNRYASEYYLKNYVGSYGILHVAFLGVFENFDNNNPSLVLAEDGYAEEDNLLSINEIKQLNLNTSMVVLSNCQSAYGEHQRGEGFIALGRSFMYAGAASVVLSLWEQQQNNSGLVLNYFYENLLKKQPKDQALQQAKLRYLKTMDGINAHPAFWASLIQFGNPESIEISEPVTHIWWFVIPIFCLGLLGWWSLQALRK